MEDKKDKKILIIEDNDIFKNMLVQKLEEGGYSTIVAEGNVSFEEVKKIKPDLLLVDIVSSNGKRANLIKQLKQGSKPLTIPIIAIAKLEGSVVVDYARELGVKDAIDKVIFDPKDMLEKVKKALKTSKEKAMPVSATSDPKTATDVSKSEGTGKKGKILLVEDDAFMRELFARGLRDAGFTVNDVPDAETGLEMLPKKMPEVILLDLLLPGKSGFDFLEEIKQDKSYRHIPVIVVSNLGSKGDIDRAIDLGAADFLVKANSTIDEIISKSEKFIEKGKKPVVIPKSLK